MTAQGNIGMIAQPSVTGGCEIECVRLQVKEIAMDQVKEIKSHDRAMHATSGFTTSHTAIELTADQLKLVVGGAGGPAHGPVVQGGPGQGPVVG